MLASYRRANDVNSDLTDPLATYTQLISGLHSLSDGTSLSSEF